MSAKETTVRRAVIDIGSNSVKLLVADVAADQVEPVWENGEQTRLGEGSYDSRRLRPSAISRTQRAVEAYHGRARELGAESVRIVATCAVRDADNRSELTEAIQDSLGVGVEALSGDEEAEWAFRGVMSDDSLADAAALIVDLGGGSTEFIAGIDREIRWRGSFALGTVRWLERMRPGDPPSPEDLSRCRASIADFLRERVIPTLEPALEPIRGESSVLIGVGGAVGILARMHLGMEEFSRPRIESCRLRASDVTEWVNRLWGLPFAARGEIPGLPPERADVMLTGACILEGVMKQSGFSEMRPSARGLRFAALMDG